MKFLIACLLTLALSAHAQGVPPEYCHYVVNWYHCGHVDERMPRPKTELAIVETPAPDLYLTVIPGWYKTSVKSTEGTWSSESWDSYIAFRRQLNISEGGDDELRALGSSVTIGEMSIGHLCIPQQKYVSILQVRETTYRITFTCNATGLAVSGPTVKRTVDFSGMKPYLGGPTWTNVK